MADSIIVRAENNKDNYLELKPNVTRGDLADYNAALRANDTDALEAILKRTVLDVQLTIEGEKIKGIEAVLSVDDETWDKATAATYYFWGRAWLMAYGEAQKLGNPIRRN